MTTVSQKELLQSALILHEMKKQYYVKLYLDERFSNNNDLSYEEIVELAKKKCSFWACLNTVRKGFEHPECRSNHSTVTSFGFNVMSVCEDMKDLPYEELRFLMFRKDMQYIGYTSATSYSALSIENEDIQKAMDKIQKRAKYVITIHNHPYMPFAVPSETDDDTWMYMKELFEKNGKQLIDDCIISPYDFFRRNTKKET